MQSHPLLSSLAAGSMTLLLLQSLSAEQVDPKPNPAPDTPGVEVLARGPVHEAYAQPLDTRPLAGPIAPKKPPAALDELPPDQRPEGDNVQWLPGYWQWDDERKDFVWVSGFWRTPPPGRKWIPGHHAKTENGYQWVHGLWAPAAQREMIYQPLPPESVETGPSVPAPADDAIYNPGSWVYQESRYRWRPGFFMDYRPGWVWNPARYLATPAGCVFVDGYWDYPLADRGLLFAPVYCDPAICFQPGFVFRPYYCWPASVLPTALFVRPGWGHYYAGDYFGAGHRRAGFTPFLDYRRGGGAIHDPLYTHYRSANAGRPWERDLRAQYAGRFAGNLARPPRTLAAPLTDVRTHGVALARVSPHQVTATKQGVQQVRDVARQRANLERPAVATRREGAIAPPTRREVSPGVTRRETAPVITKKEAVHPPPIIRKVDNTPVARRETTITPRRETTPPTPNIIRTSPPHSERNAPAARSTPPSRSVPPPARISSPPPPRSAPPPARMSSPSPRSAPPSARTSSPPRSAPPSARQSSPTPNRGGSPKPKR